MENKFSYKSIYSLGEYVYSWSVTYEGTVFNGTSSSISKAYKDAKKEIKRHRKMKKFMNEN